MSSMHEIPGGAIGERSDGCINLTLVGNRDCTIRPAPPAVRAMIAEKYGHLLTEEQRNNYRRLDETIIFNDEQAGENGPTS